MPVKRLGDEREQRYAYVTDRTRLYQVLEAGEYREGLKRPETRIWLENCSSGATVVVDRLMFLKRMSLVRAAPAWTPEEELAA